MTKCVQLILLSMMFVLLDPLGQEPGFGVSVSTHTTVERFKGSTSNLHRTPNQDHEGSQDHTRSEPPLEPASAETWSPERSESPAAPQRSPEVAGRHGERCRTAVEEEEEEKGEEMEVVEKRSGSGEDVQMSSPDRSSLEGKFSFY